MNAERGSITAKFGGSSLASGECIQRVGEIVRKNPERQFVVVSAPGKDEKHPQKVTDLLYEVSAAQEEGRSHIQTFERVAHRFEQIGRELHFHNPVVGWLNTVEEGIQRENGQDWIVSRGEWMMAQIFAQLIDGEFHDAAPLIKLDENTGCVLPMTYDLIRTQLLPREGIYHVIPGFYGSIDMSITNPDYVIVKVFPRGGSDITGAIIAKGTESRVYENWSDVPGVLAADPKVVENPKIIPRMSYQQMRELGYRGANVLHSDAIIPAAEAHIPINLRSTFEPENPGTWITQETNKQPPILGIAGKAGFTSFHIEEVGLNARPGIGEAILGIFKEYGVSYEHSPTSIDGFSMIVDEKYLNGKEGSIIGALQTLFPHGSVTAEHDLGLVCVVGEGIKKNPTLIHAKFYMALQAQKIVTKCEIYHIGGNNIIIGVSDKDVNRTIQALYDTFIKPR
ncbi:MAG TPA: aspartate kinase [Patescibacteria group bacterium]|nr:aspartate kinase [Patescibacteria group bacterium]